MTLSDSILTYLADLEGAVTNLKDTWRPQDLRYRADVYRQTMTSLSYSYFAYFHADAEHPDWAIGIPGRTRTEGRQQLVLELVDELRRDGLTVVTTMHDLTLAGQYAERLVLLNEGSVVAEGTAVEVLSAPNVAAHYAANVRIIEDDRGGVFVLPVRR